MAKALALVSGGLDSTLAVRLIQEQQIPVEGVHFISLFCANPQLPRTDFDAKRAARRLGIPLRVVNFTTELLRIIKSPAHGYGSNMNPCIDCRIATLIHSAGMMKEMGADFLITGEVLGERPMSQRRYAMRLIDREAQVEGLVLRPLSAQLLEPTIPEERGWVDRARLCAISGRSRKPQFELARRFGITEYPTPAGGCLLTDPCFADRMRDLLKHDPGCTLNDAHLLKVGRHFRLGAAAKAVVGRKQVENGTIESFAREGDLLMEVSTHSGPVTLVRGDATEEQLMQAAAITARYGKAGALPLATLRVWRPGARSAPVRTLEVVPAQQTAIDGLRIEHEEKPRTGGGRAHAE